jgi:hypothetical protein
MFETQWGCTLRAAAGWFFGGFAAGGTLAMLPPLLAALSLGSDELFPPAPYFLLALGVGLFIGVVVAVLASRQP